MRTHALRLVSPATILAAAALSAGAAAAAQHWPLPEGAVPVAVAASVSGREDGAAIDDAGGGVNGDIGAPPASRLLRSLGGRAARPGSPAAPAEGRGAGPVSGAAGTQVGGLLYGCPRALLGSLLASAADARDAVSALAIERETLALCRERQEIVNGIVALEVELGTLLAEARLADAGVPAPVVGAAAVATPIAPVVKRSAPVRVVSLPPADDDAGEAAEEKPESLPAPPDYAWFSIIGTAGDLRAGIGDGSRVWFVREGDRLPGGVLITGIGTDTPGVRVGDAGKALLPYRPLGAGAGAAAGGQHAGEGP